MIETTNPGTKVTNPKLTTHAWSAMDDEACSHYWDASTNSWVKGTSPEPFDIMTNPFGTDPLNGRGQFGPVSLELLAATGIPQHSDPAVTRYQIAREELVALTNDGREAFFNVVFDSKGRGTGVWTELELAHPRSCAVPKAREVQLASRARGRCESSHSSRGEEVHGLPLRVH